MFWYLLQVSMITYIVYKYATDIAPEVPLSHIFLFAITLTYLTTLLISKSIDGIRYLLRQLSSYKRR